MFPRTARPCLSLVAALLCGSTLGAQAPSHVYTLDGGSLADALGGPSLVHFGTNAPATMLGASGFSFGAPGGFTLSNALGATPTDYTIELRFLFDNVGGYRKIVDFEDRSADAGLYNQSSALVFYPSAGGPAGAFTAGVFTTVVITRDGSGDFVGYANGVQQFSFNAGGLATFTGVDGIIHFLHDDGVQSSEQSSGFVDYIRLYDRALTAGEVAGLTPPVVSAVPEPATVALLATGLLAVGGVAARRRRRA